MKDGVQPLEVGHQFIALALRIEAINPQGVVVVAVQNRHAPLKPQQVLVAHGDAHGAPVLVEVGLQPRKDGIDLFLFGNQFVIHRGEVDGPLKERLGMAPGSFEGRIPH